MKRVLRIGLVAALVFGVTAVVFQGASAQQNPVAEEGTVLDSTTVQRNQMVVTVSGTGAIEPARQVNLVFETTAPVTEVLVQEGEFVMAGDVLARLEATDLLNSLQDAQVSLDMQQAAYDQTVAPARDVDIAAAQAALTAAQASAGAASQGADAETIEIARIQAEQARNQLWQQQLDRDRLMSNGPEFRGAGPTGAPAQAVQVTSGLTQAETQIQIAEAQYADAVNQGPDLAALGSAQAQITQAQVNLDRLENGPDEFELGQADIALQQAALRVAQAQTALDKATLIAPFDGVVAANNLVVGEAPPPSGPAMLLLDISGYYVDLSIDETDIAQVAVGQPVALDLDALGEQTLDGTVTRVAVTPTVQGQLVTYAVRVSVDSASAPLRVGMTATAIITVSNLHDTLVIPNRYIRLDRETQKAYVTIRRLDGQFEEVEVQLGLRNEGSSQVINGLSAGQQIFLLPRASFNPLGG